MKYGVWWVSVDKKEQKEYFDSETARMEKIKELMGMKLPWKLIPERGPEKATTARDVLRIVDEMVEPLTGPGTCDCKNFSPDAMSCKTGCRVVVNLPDDAPIDAGERCPYFGDQHNCACYAVSESKIKEAGIKDTTFYPHYQDLEAELEKLQTRAEEIRKELADLRDKAKNA